MRSRPAARDTFSRDDDVYLAVPLQKGQISCRELMRGEVLLKAVRRTLRFRSTPSTVPTPAFLAESQIYARGIDPVVPAAKAEGKPAAPEV